MGLRTILWVCLAVTANAVMMKSANDESMPSKRHMSRKHKDPRGLFKKAVAGLASVVDTITPAIPDIIDAVMHPERETSTDDDGESLLSAWHPPSVSMSSDSDNTEDDTDEDEMSKKNAREEEEEDLDVSEQVKTGMRMHEIIRDAEAELGGNKMRASGVVERVGDVIAKEFLQAGRWQLIDELGPDVAKVLGKEFGPDTSEEDRDHMKEALGKTKEVARSMASAASKVEGELISTADSLLRDAKVMKDKLKEDLDKPATEPETSSDGEGRKEGPEVAERIAHGVGQIAEGVGDFITSVLPDIIDAVRYRLQE